MKYLFSNTKTSIIIFILSLAVYILCLLSAAAISVTKDKPITLTISNPYFLGLESKVLCDWNEETEEYAFERVYIIKGKSSTTLSFPSSVKNCHLSPKIVW